MAFTREKFPVKTWTTANVFILNKSEGMLASLPRFNDKVNCQKLDKKIY